MQNTAGVFPGRAFASSFLVVSGTWETVVGSLLIRRTKGRFFCISFHFSKKTAGVLQPGETFPLV